MLKKRVLALAALTALSALLMACGQKEQAQTAATEVAASDEEKILNIYNWPDYISESMIPDF